MRAASVLLIAALTACAQRVRMELIRRGIRPEQIESVAGRGKREPLVPHGPGVPEPKNRRVEISVR
jgi:OmpA-OmpF porin, OOP family